MNKDFIQHTPHWTRGEIFEGSMIALFGVLLLVCSLLCRTVGNTPHARALIVPLAIVGVLLAAAGTYMYFSNQTRLTEYQEAFEKNEQAFVQSEKKRVEDLYVHRLYHYLSSMLCHYDLPSVVHF